MKTVFKITAISFFLMLVVVACKKHSPDPTPSTASFDTKGMLTNMANNIIIPSYMALNKAVNQADSTVKSFSTNPNATTLLNAQNAFKQLYMAWQSCSEFQFGPADQQTLSENVNTFPTDTTKISANIKA